MPVRIKLSKAGDRVERKELVLDQDLISIGRESSSAIPLAGSLVSKRHARIQRRGGSYSVVDLKSTNSTFLNGERLVPDREYPLHEGDLVRVANFDLEVLSLNGPESPVSGGPAEGPQTMAAVSTLLKGAGISRVGGGEPGESRFPAEELKAALLASQGLWGSRTATMPPAVTTARSLPAIPATPIAAPIST